MERKNKEHTINCDQCALKRKCYIVSQYKRLKQGCPCRECLVGIICSRFCEKRLDYNTNDMARAFERIKDKIKITRCLFCRYDKLDEVPINYYDHEGGIEIDGKKYWLYITCPKCNFDWSIFKLGVQFDL